MISILPEMQLRILSLPLVAWSTVLGSIAWETATGTRPATTRATKVVECMLDVLLMNDVIM